MSHDKLVSIKRNSENKTWEVTYKSQVRSSHECYDDAVDAARSFMENVSAHWLGVDENNVYSEQTTTSLNFAQLDNDVIYVTQRRLEDRVLHVELNRDEAKEMIERLTELLEITES